jgi:thiol:disulfide interchange protein/DsbC/DsbD-like thiol-disulfide interchange protein
MELSSARAKMEEGQGFPAWLERTRVPVLPLGASRLASVKLRGVDGDGSVRAMRRSRAWAVFGLGAWLAAFAASGVARTQEFEGKTLVRPRLLANTATIEPGKPFKVGLLLEHAAGWHTYWQYPGDAGIPTRIEWTLPEGFVAGPIEWPLPRAILEPGDIEAYAYRDRVLLITTITPPAAIGASEVTVKAKASWLVCEEICIPGSAELELKLPVGGTSATANSEVFAEFERLVPSAEGPPFPVSWKRGMVTGAGGREVEGWILHLDPRPGPVRVSFYPLPADGQTVGHPAAQQDNDYGWDIGIAADGDIRGVLAIETADGRSAWLVASGTGEGAAVSAAVAGGIAAADGVTQLALWEALWWGFLGGLILNLMPCVLPVISLKIFGFIRQAGDDPRRILAHGMAFVGGIFAWFLGLAAVVIAVKASGGAATWAFQFQNPYFNLVIAAGVFVFALNLFGVFEIVLPGRATDALARAGEREGLSGSFFQGIFATLLATPCTAPFLSGALGFAFSQNAPVIVAMFASVALGMASPYFLLSANPGWMKFLPRPGAWMERVKQFMGFPLIATLLWLLFIIGRQKGLDAAIWSGAFLLCLGVACWIYGAFLGPQTRPPGKLAAVVALIIVAFGGGAYSLSHFEKHEFGWVPFSKSEMDKLLATGKPIFVDFTADWCITCKFNEKTAIDVPAVRALMQELGIVPVKADWTNADPEITAALKQFGRVGVPFYLFYPEGGKAAPIVLPEVLTEQIVLAALKKAS